MPGKARGEGGFCSLCLGIVGVILGFGTVGVAGVLYGEPRQGQGELIPGAYMATGGASTTAHTLLGTLLIAGAQVFIALQLIVEECILTSCALEPVDLVGYEGLFGMVLTTSIMIALYFANGQLATGTLEPFDILEGWRQLTTIKSVLVSGILVMISIGYASVHYIVR